MKLLVSLAAAAAIALVPGCEFHANGHPHWHAAIEVTIPSGHVHDLFCGHCFFKGKWYLIPDHVHGETCGHVFRDGFWHFEEEPE